MPDNTSVENSANILSEHQAPPMGPDLPGDAEREAELKEVREAEKLFNAAKRCRRKVDKHWLELYKFWKGKQWKERRPSYRHSEVLNFIQSEVNTVFSLLLDAKPNVDTIPEDPSDYEFSEIMTQTLRSNWERQRMSHTLAEVAMDGIVLGTGVGHCPWDPEKNQGIGDYKFESIDTFYFYVDPNCRGDINDKEHCAYVFTAIPTYVDRVKAKYPDKAKEIKADIADLTQIGRNREDLNEVRLTSPIDKGMVFQESEEIYGGEPNRVLVKTLYMRPNDVDEVQEMGYDADGNESNQSVVKPKYPQGRKLVYANNHILEDTVLDDPDLLFPFGTFPSELNPRSVWGTGDVEILKNPQVIINKLVSYILDVLIIMGNPIWVVDDEAGVDDDNLLNQPGLVINKSKEGDIRREAGVGLQPFVIQTLEMFMDRVWEKLRTSSEVSQGVAPSSNVSGFAIEQLQQASQTKIRSKARNLDFFLHQIGQLQINHILSKYTAPRIFRITNSQGAMQYFKMSVNDEPVTESQPTQVVIGQDEFGGPIYDTQMQDVPTGEMQKVATLQKIEMDSGTNQPIFNDVQKNPIKGKFDIRINTGTELPISKANKANTARQLFLDGVYDAEDYLNALDVPNKEKILEKLKQREAAQAQMQQAQAAQPAPPQGGPPLPQ